MKIYPDVNTSPMLQKQELKLTAKLEIARFIFHLICTLIKMHQNFSFIFTFRCFRSERYRWDQTYPKTLLNYLSNVAQVQRKIVQDPYRIACESKIDCFGSPFDEKKVF